VRDEEELQRSLAWARDRKTSVTVLGGGSNVVLLGDLNSMVLTQASLGIEVLKDTDEEVVLRVCAGENWHDLVQWTLARGYYGLENLALIPGTVGAAPIQNIGAYGVELESYVEAVHAIQIEDSEKIILTREACEFAYRDSVFKHRLRDTLVITEVQLRLSRCADLHLDYPALASVLRDKPRESLTPLDVFDEVVNLRQSKLPDPTIIPNVGSFFKNPVLEHHQAVALCDRYPELPAYPQLDGRGKGIAKRV
jgi:UDP-N-acetylmuramate dehydrogenase